VWESFPRAETNSAQSAGFSVSIEVEPSGARIQRSAAASVQCFQSQRLSNTWQRCGFCHMRRWLRICRNRRSARQQFGKFVSERLNRSHRQSRHRMRVRNSHRASIMAFRSEVPCRLQRIPVSIKTISGMWNDDNALDENSVRDDCSVRRHGPCRFSGCSIIAALFRSIRVYRGYKSSPPQ
jgi:hypothetical protein